VNNQKLYWIVLGTVVTLGVMVGCIAALPSPRVEQPDPVIVTQAAVVTATATATPTIAPTAVPTPPPPPLTVAATPPPAAVPIASRADSVSNYSAEMTQLFTQYQASVEHMVTLTNDPHPESAYWRQQAEAEWGKWHGYYAWAQSLNPPPCLADVHRRILAAFALFDQAATNGIRGLETSQPGPLSTAHLQVEQANNILRTVVPDLQNHICGYGTGGGN